MKQNKNFTIIEFFIVLAVVAVLATLLFPSLNKVLSHSTDLKCRNNLKGIGINRTLYSEDNDDEFLAWRTRVGPQGPRSLSWWSFLLPYMGLERDKKWGTTTDVEALNCSVPRDGLMTNNYNTHQGYGYNNAFNIDRYSGAPPFFCYSRKLNDVAKPNETIEVGDNFRLPGYTRWNGDVRMLLNGAHPSFLNNCADVHQGMSQLLWVDAHVSADSPVNIQANGRDWYDLN